MLMDYGSLPPERRNILRFIFLDPRARAAQYDCESVARFVVGAFRVDAARAGAAAEVEPLVDELCRRSHSPPERTPGISFARREFQFCSTPHRMGMSGRRYHPVHEE